MPIVYTCRAEGSEAEEEADGGAAEARGGAGRRPQGVEHGDTQGLGDHVSTQYNT